MSKFKLSKKYYSGVFLILTSIYSLINILYKLNFYKLSSVLIIAINIYSMAKFYKNKKILMILLMLFYFNFSVIFGKYLFGGTMLLNNIYGQLVNYDLTMALSINLLLLFNSLMILNIGQYKEINNSEYYFEVSKGINKYLNCFLSFIIIFVLIYMFIKKINYNISLFEYLDIVFIFAFLLNKKNKKWKIFYEFLMILACAYSFYMGDRISGLQIILIDFIINYLYKIKLTQIICVGVIGLLFFTVLGVYGDLKDTDMLENFSFALVNDQFSNRRFTSDTAIAAYFPSAALIEVRDSFPSEERLKNGVEYFTTYTLLGQSIYKYKLPIILILKYYFHTGGGFIIGYFYFWFGILGVIGIAIYIGLLLKRSLNSNKKLGFFNVYSIFLIATFPRWYLYYPTNLFRGTLIFIIFYYIMFVAFKIKIKPLLINDNKFEEV